MFKAMMKKLARSKKGAALVARKLPRYGENSTNQLHWYFGGLACFQMGGSTWKAWYQAFKREIPSNQTTDGDAAGTWARRGPWTGAGGPVIATALTTMCLETAYRYARVFK